MYAQYACTYNVTLPETHSHTYTHSHTHAYTQTLPAPATIRCSSLLNPHLSLAQKEADPERTPFLRALQGWKQTKVRTHNNTHTHTHRYT